MLLLAEELSLAAIHDQKKDWQRDFDRLIEPLVEETTPCYLLYRLDEKSSLGHVWLLLTWVPETAAIRQKMLYASTKATLKTEFGSAYIKEELHATQRAELTLDGYLRHKAVHSAPAPLSMREEEMLELRQLEANTTAVHTESRHQTLGGLQCAMSAPAVQAIADLAHGAYNYLQFSIDLQAERIELAKAAVVELAALQREVPADRARYHLYVFKHTHEGDYAESVVFVYSMPGYSCSVKERMMYSSCKAPFVDQIAALGVDIAKKVRRCFCGGDGGFCQRRLIIIMCFFFLHFHQLEVDEGAELTEDFLHEELHPKKILHRPVFAKPKGPPNRGAKRLTRPQATFE